MKLTVRKIRLTAAKADELSHLNTYRGQRKKSSQHIKDLAAKMKDGRFHVGQIAVVHDNGHTRLIDGQHQCEACKISGVSVDANLLEYQVEPDDTDVDVANVYAQFNVDRARNRGDVAWGVGSLIGYGDYPKKCVKTAAAALTWLDAGLDHSGGATQLTKDESAMLLAESHDEVAFIREVIWHGGNSVAKHLDKVTVAVSVLATFAKDRDAAREFWIRVRDGEMLTRGDPAFKLREFLLTTGTKTTGEKKVVPRREMVAKCIHAWNAYRSRKRLVNLKFHEGSPTPRPR